MGLEERSARAQLLTAIEKACDQSSKSWEATWADDGSRVVIDFPRIAELALERARAEADAEADGPEPDEPEQDEDVEDDEDQDDEGDEESLAFVDTGQSVPELRDLLRAQGKPVSGTRAQLVARLTE